MVAFIFAAGIGSRLRPLTDTMPKALVPLAGRPLFDHVVSGLQRQGVTDFVVNIHHFADMLRRYVLSRPDAHHFSISDESDKLLDTGGAVKHAANLIGNNHFLIHNVDIISNFDLSQMMSAVKSNALATLLVSHRATSRYLLFDDDMRLVGWTNISTGEVKSPYPEINVDSCTKLAFAGIHYISPRVFQMMSAWPDKFSIIDFYLHYAADFEIYGYVQPDLNLIDVGKPEALKKCEEFLDKGV